MTTKPATLSPEALDFAPGLLSIQESPPARLPRTVMYTVSVLFAILLLWAMFGKLDIIASAEGVTDVAGNALKGSLVERTLTYVP